MTIYNPFSFPTLPISPFSPSLKKSPIDFSESLYLPAWDALYKWNYATLFFCVWPLFTKHNATKCLPHCNMKQNFISELEKGLIVKPVYYFSKWLEFSFQHPQWMAYNHSSRVPNTSDFHGYPHSQAHTPHTHTRGEQRIKGKSFIIFIFALVVYSHLLSTWIFHQVSDKKFLMYCAVPWRRLIIMSHCLCMWSLAFYLHIDHKPFNSRFT